MKMVMVIKYKDGKEKTLFYNTKAEQKIHMFYLRKNENEKIESITARRVNPAK